MGVLNATRALVPSALPFAVCCMCRLGPFRSESAPCLELHQPVPFSTRNQPPPCLPCRSQSALEALAAEPGVQLQFTEQFEAEGGE